MEELDLKELFMIFWNKKIIIIISIIVFLVLGVIYTSFFVTPEYTSSTTLVLTTSTEEGEELNEQEVSQSITSNDLTINSRLVATYSELVKSNNVLREVISNLNIDVSEEALRQNVTVTSVEDTDLIEIKVTNTNAEYAALIANEIAKVFTEKVKEIYNISNVYVVDIAEVSEHPSNVNNIRDIVIFMLIGGVISVIYILIANMLDTTVKTEEEIEKVFDMPVLISIPKYDFVELEEGGNE